MVGVDREATIVEQWARVRGRLRTEVGEAAYRSWLKPLTLAGYASKGQANAPYTIVEYADFGQAVALREGQVDAATGFANNEPVQLALVPDDGAVEQFSAQRADPTLGGAVRDAGGEEAAGGGGVRGQRGQASGVGIAKREGWEVSGETPNTTGEMPVLLGTRRTHSTLGDRITLFCHKAAGERARQHRSVDYCRRARQYTRTDGPRRPRRDKGRGGGRAV